MQQHQPQRPEDKHRPADIETGKPQDPRDRRMPGEGSPDAERSQQQRAQQGTQKQHGTGNKPGAQQGNPLKEPPKQQQQRGGTGEQYGEGNYTASRHYNDRAKQFAESGKVEQAARDAAPRDQDEARQLRDAEQAGKSRMKEEDPALQPGKPRKPGICKER